MRGRTDLALEHLENFSAQKGADELEGIYKNEYEKFGCRCTDIEIKSERGAEMLQKERGRYVTINLPDMLLDPDGEKAVENALSDILLDLIPSFGTVLVVGLGNAEITPDALGPLVAGKILSTRHIPKDIAAKTGLSDLRSVCSIPVGVLGQTGIESEETVRAVAKAVSASSVVLVDALAAASMGRLFNTVQITDTGISPGSGVQNKRKKISSETMDGISVIAIGVPTVTDADSIISESGGVSPAENMVVTPKDIDRLITASAKVVSKALNRALFPSLSSADIDYLVL